MKQYNINEIFIESFYLSLILLRKQIKKISNGKYYSFCDKCVFIKWKYEYYILRENYSISRRDIYLEN